MPRQSDSKHPGTQFYHSQFPNSHPSNVHYVSDASVPPLANAHTNQPSPQHQSHPAAPAPKKKHFCPTCDRAFTTSGHLARHSRVHTGERNHKCPFPGCETRCSRQDNLQQHYRIHLSPGSRRSSTRSAIARAMSNSAQPNSGSHRRSSTVSTADSPIPPPLSAPPALEPARGYSMSSPPNSPPPLAQATLPATAHPPPDSVSSRSSSSPEISYSPLSPHHSHLVSMSGHSLGLNGHHPQYSYRSGTTTYQEQSQGAGFTYVHTTPISQTAGSNGSQFSYSSGSYDHHSLPHINTSPLHHSQALSSPPSPSSAHVSSRHSISHISHPQSYPHSQPSSASPPSPASTHSTSSHASGPTTPTYPMYSDEAHAYQGNNMIMEHGHDQSGLSSGHISSQGQLVHPGYSPTLPVHSNLNRFKSASPTLPPIQDERVIRGDPRHLQSGSSPYLHHPQPLSNDYQYHHSLSLGHGAWKTDTGMRSKGVGALVQ